MLSIDAYIVFRKQEDNLNELDPNKCVENAKICENYVFEYFNIYLNTIEVEKKTKTITEDMIKRYKYKITDYSPKVCEWLIRIYADYGRQMSIAINSFLEKETYFLLFDSDDEFKRLTNFYYLSQLKMFPFLKGQEEMIYLFIKDNHFFKNNNSYLKTIPFIKDNINSWFERTKSENHVNLLAFVSSWIHCFCKEENIDPFVHLKKVNGGWQRYIYDYYQKRNLFNFDLIYEEMPQKSFTTNRKMEFEVLLLYYWLSRYAKDDESYLYAYVDRVLKK